MSQIETNYYNKTVDKIKEAENCRVLWLSVLETALSDYCHGRDAKKIGNWIGSRNFKLVCHYADVDHGTVEKIFKKAKKNIDKRNM